MLFNFPQAMWAGELPRKFFFYAVQLSLFLCLQDVVLAPRHIRINESHILILKTFETLMKQRRLPSALSTNQEIFFGLHSLSIGTLRNMLQSAEELQDTFSQTGVYRIPCWCGSIYVEITERHVARNQRQPNHKPRSTNRSAAVFRNPHPPLNTVSFPVVKSVAIERSRDEIFGMEKVFNRPHLNSPEDISLTFMAKMRDTLTSDSDDLSDP